MAALGKSLVFYFKYWNEMTRLCTSEGGELAELEDLPNPENTREMAVQVGAKADRQAAEFLEACAPEIEKHFKSIGQCKRKTSRKVVERKWSIEFNIWPKYKRAPAKPKMTAGVDIQRLDKPEIIPWIWRQGGEEAEKTLEHILGNRAKVRARELDWSPGTIGLERFSIMPDRLEGFDIDRDSLIERVQQAFRVFSPQDLDALWPK
jgi:hypothetical protein